MMIQIHRKQFFADAPISKHIKQQKLNRNGLRKSLCSQGLRKSNPRKDNDGIHKFHKSIIIAAFDFSAFNFFDNENFDSPGKPLLQKKFRITEIPEYSLIRNFEKTVNVSKYNSASQKNEKMEK